MLHVERFGGFVGNSIDSQNSYREREARTMIFFPESLFFVSFVKNSRNPPFSPRSHIEFLSSATFDSFSSCRLWST